MGHEDLELIVRAVEEAAKCVSEPGKVSPKVGAALAAGGKLIDAAYLGEADPGDHAEFILLSKKRPTFDLAGATVYTTLEPCTERNPPKVPCASRLLERGVVEVVIGMLDPDSRVYGIGFGALKKAGVTVRFFPQHLRDRLYALRNVGLCRESLLAFVGLYPSAGSFDQDGTNPYFSMAMPRATPSRLWAMTRSSTTGEVVTRGERCRWLRQLERLGDSLEGRDQREPVAHRGVPPAPVFTREPADQRILIAGIGSCTATARASGILGTGRPSPHLFLPFGRRHLIGHGCLFVKQLRHNVGVHHLQVGDLAGVPRAGEVRFATQF